MVREPNEIVQLQSEMVENLNGLVNELELQRELFIELFIQIEADERTASEVLDLLERAGYLDE